MLSSSPHEGRSRHNESGGEESEDSEPDEESELMKKIMGFNKFDTTKVSVSIKS